MATVTVDPDLLVGLTVTSTVVDLHVPNQLTVSGGTGSSTLAGLTDVALDGIPTEGQEATFDADGKLTNVSVPGASGRPFHAFHTFFNEYDPDLIAQQVEDFYTTFVGYGSFVYGTPGAVFFAYFNPDSVDNGFFQWTPRATAEGVPTWTKIADLPGETDWVAVDQALRFNLQSDPPFFGYAERHMLLVGNTRPIGNTAPWPHTQILPRPVKNVITITGSDDVPDSWEVQLLDASGGDVICALPPTNDSTGVYNGRAFTFIRIDASANEAGFSGDILDGPDTVTDLRLASGEVIRLLGTDAGWRKIGGFGGASGGGLDETAVQALIDASDISIAKIVSDGMGTTLPDILVASTIARDTEVAAGDAATLASAEGYTDTAVAGKVSATTVDAKGDLLVGTADNTVARLAVGSDGRVPIASANETTGLIYARPAIALVASGRYSTSAFTWSSATVAANRLFYVPFLVPKRLTFDRIAVNHSATTGGSGSVARLGIYASSGDLPAGLILDAGTIDLTTSPALKAVTISQTLDPGMYWLAAVAQTVAPASSFSCVSSGPVVPSDAAAGSGSSYGLAESSVTGGLPSSATPGATAFQPVNVWLRAA